MHNRNPQADPIGKGKSINQAMARGDRQAGLEGEGEPGFRSGFYGFRGVCFVSRALGAEPRNMKARAKKGEAKGEIITLQREGRDDGRGVF